MAVLRKMGGELPKDAVFLDTKEAVRYQWNQVQQHQPKYEMWSFRYGYPMLSVCTGASSMYINDYLRRGLRLKNYGRLASYVPLTVTPVFLVFVLQRICVSDVILLQSVPCSLCLNLRAVAIQTGFGVLYPLIAAPIANLMVAHQFATVKLPAITDFKGHLELFQKITKPLAKRLPYLVCAHIIFAFFITSQQMRAFNCFYDKLLRKEETALDAVTS